MRQGIHPQFSTAPIKIAVEDLPDDPDAQVAATINRVVQYIREDANYPELQSQARMAIRIGNGDPLAGVWRHLKSSMTFRHDEDIAQEVQGLTRKEKAQIIEVLIRPIDQLLLILRKGGFEDCDGYNMYACALLYTLGIPVKLVTVSADSREPDKYSHVYTAVYLNGRRIPMDFSHGPHIGWECPNTGRLREWSVQPTWGERFVDGMLAIGLVTAGYAGLRWASRKVAV